MSWITREFQFSKSQAEREFNCPLYKNYVRAAKTAKGTKWQRDPRKNLLSKFTMVDNPCQRVFLFCNREKAREFFEKDWNKRKFQEPVKKRKVNPWKNPNSASQGPNGVDLVTKSSRRNVRGEVIDTAREIPSTLSSAAVWSSIFGSQIPQIWALSNMNETNMEDRNMKIGVFIRGFK